MIGKIRDKRRIANGSNDTRKRVSRVGRWAYIGLLAVFFLWIFDLVLGPLVRLRADGLVISEYVSVAVPFPAQVSRVAVTPGARVVAGEMLAQVQSVELTQSIATGTARLAELQTTQADIQRKVRVADAVLAVARHRAAEAEKAVRRIDDIRETGHVAIVTWSQALQDRYDAMERVAGLQAEVTAATAGLTATNEAMAQAAAALEELRHAYNAGVIRAPTEGIVGLRTARPGDVVPLGGSLMVLYQPGAHVLAYLETGTLYSVSPGDEVQVSDGFVTSSGRITEVLPVADALPEEFRKAFQPRARSQVARVALAPDAPFPLFAKVHLSGIGLASPLAVAHSWLTRLAFWISTQLDAPDPRASKLVMPDT